VDIITDASSIINLDNAKALDLVAQLPNRTLWLSPLVISECEPTCAAEIFRLKDLERIQFVNPERVPADLFLQILADHELGEGETECLALCLQGPYVLCCDDHKARRIAIELIGANRVIGSLRLLRWLVVEKLASAEDVYHIYEAMRAAGGFLPSIDRSWFSED
jgi:predicted nucleic acid-binding protein